MLKGPHEDAEHVWQSVIRRRPPRGLSHLLVMDPGLGELAGVVEPGRNRLATRPADPGWLEDVSLCRPRLDLPGGVSEQTTDDTRAESLRGVDPPLVLGCERIYERSPSVTGKTPE
jgi:hypothetical protein